MLIAPVGATKIFPDVFENIELPSLLMHGQNDRMGAQSSKVLEHLPSHTTVEVPNAGHACYLDATDMFHAEVAKFVLATAVSSRQSRSSRRRGRS